MMERIAKRWFYASLYGARLNPFQKWFILKVLGRVRWNIIKDRQ